MAWVFADRVLDTSITTGTGALALSGTSPLGWRAFSTVCAVGDAFYYTIYDPITGAWETGEGSYSALNTVARNTVRASTNAGALVNFAANAKSVFIDVIGYYFGTVPAGGPFLPLGGGTLTGALTGTSATFVGGQSTLTVKNAATGATSIVLRRDGAATDEKAWEIFDGSGGGLNIRSLDDAGVTGVNAIAVGRGTGTALGSVTITPPLVLNGALTGTSATFNTGANSAVRIANDASNANYNVISLNGLATETAMVGFLGGGTGDGNLYANVPTGFNYVWRINGVATLQHLGGYLIPSVDLGLRLGGPSNRWLDVQANTATFAGTLTGAAATFSGSMAAATFISSVDASNYALQLGRYSAGFGRVAVNTRGAYGYEFQVNGVAALQLDATVATFASTVMAPGAQIQLVSVETGAVATGTTTIPFDDTVPQQTEGDQYMSLAITPKSATSKLVIDVVIVLANQIAGVSNTIVALFQDATANALASVLQTHSTQSAIQTIKFTHTMTSGTTSPTTFKVRAGTNGAGTTTFNGSGGARLFGGTMASSIVIREVAP